MNDRQLLEHMVAIGTLQLQVLLEIRRILARQARVPESDYAFGLPDVADHASMQRERVLERLGQRPD